MGNKQAKTGVEEAGTAAAANRVCLLVLGMHRAGTSALTRVMSLCGAELPRDLLPANEGNPTGYWEPRGVVELNDELLDYFGVTWDDPFAAFHIPEAASIPARFYERAAEILEREYADAKLFALKDPRCSLLAEFWASALQVKGVSCCPVVIMRPYMEVADSLQRRDGTSLASAVMVYVAYGLKAVEFGDRHDAVFLTYDQLVADWTKATDAISKKFGFEWPKRGTASAAEIDEFLVKPDRQAPPAQLPRQLKEWADGIWHGIVERSLGAHRKDDVASIRVGLRAASDMFSPTMVERARRMRQVSDELDAAIEVERKLHSLFDESQQTLAKAARDRDEAQRRAIEIAQQRDELEADRNRALAVLEQTRDELEADRNNLLAMFRELERARDGLVAERDGLVAERDEIERAKTDLLRQHQHLCAIHAESLVELDRVSSELEHYRATLQQVYESTSWKLTKPLRAARRAGARLVGASPRTLLPRSQTAQPQATATPVPSGAVEDIGRRSHPGLMAFLAAEFDASVADQVVSRIDHYRLPVGTAEVRSAISVESSLEEANEWAQAIADAANLNVALDSDAPDVSIVVPVYNQITFTLACIDALVAHRTQLRFEILVGDDCSTDSTQDVLSVSIRGVRHVRHPRNLGFVRNCNATSELARGRYVVFLNNDTQVLPNWLDELIGVLESNTDVGLSGSKLVYPDGRMQECGAIVWKDGSAWNFGRFDDPRKPEYCYLRDVDYVSGASIALPVSLWRQLGGFDEEFAPAYAEDADLAFRVRDAGFRTVVQPLSQLLHFEGVTSGTDTSQGTKAYQVENLKKLYRRWQDVLQSHRVNADRPDLEKERNVRKRVLFIDHCTPTPNEDAGSLVAWEIMAAFQKQGYKVTFIPEDNFAHMGRDTRDLQRTGIETIYHPSYSFMTDFLEARHDPFDVIFLHRYKVGQAHLHSVRKHFPSAKIIFLNADMHFLREMREAEISGDPDSASAARETRSRELAVVRGVDYALVHSDVELAILREECPATPAALFPLIHDPVESHAPLSGRDGVCFVGGFRHPPNADGIIWFVENGWQKVVAAHPDARLYIVGSNVTPEVRALEQQPGVEVVGFVHDLETFLACRRVSIAPLRYGAGAKGKVAASLANGLPAVCTPVAIEGMQLTPDRNVLVGDTAHDLAEHVTALLADDACWQALAEAGLVYAHEVTSRRHAVRRIQLVLQELGLIA
jgi:GT2 family glycosyltransferase